MGFMLPMLGFACLFLTGLIADLYLCVQIFIFVSRKHNHQPWSILWLIGNVLLALGLLLCVSHPQVFPISPQVIFGYGCIFLVPFFWLIAFYRFKKTSSKRSTDNSGIDLASEYIIDIRDSDYVWPPPPKR